MMTFTEEMQKAIRNNTANMEGLSPERKIDQAFTNGKWTGKDEILNKHHRITTITTQIRRGVQVLVALTTLGKAYWYDFERDSWHPLSDLPRMEVPNDL